MAVKPIPDGFHSVTAYLSVKGAADAIAFFKKAFGAEEQFRFGHVWCIGTHKEDLAPEEIGERAQAMFREEHD